VRTEKQDAFIRAFCETGNASKAAEMAGYSAKCSKQKGYELKKQFLPEIQETTRQMLVESVPGLLTQLQTLANFADSETVRLGALRDLLDRAGLKPVEKVEQQVTTVQQASTDDLKRELEALTGSTEVEEIPARLN
tara:strand:- start:255 stop:662 length:408 start_codon:yes stop_codon:yes gene_type:complete